MLVDSVAGVPEVTVSVGRKGKAKVKGKLSCGGKLRVSAQGVLAGDGGFAIPVMDSRRGIGFVVWIAESGEVDVTDVTFAEKTATAAKRR